MFFDKRQGFFLLAMLAAACSNNAEGMTVEAGCREKPAKPIPLAIMDATFDAAHPDLGWRRSALRAFRKGNYKVALRDFMRSASYADKFSQWMVARMYWEGTGIKQDRPLAYAWMDLAAERMYHDFLRQRELYWAMLDDAQRADAVQRGRAVYDEYGDNQAKPRMEKVLRRVRNRITGSRLGYVSSGLHVQTNGELMPGSVYYDKEYWDPELYWCYQDSFWSRPLNPNVEVGAPEQIPQTPQSQD